MLSRKRIGGFTFLELMLVLLILALVAMTAIPNYIRFKRRQDVASAAMGVRSDLINARTLAEREERAVEVIFQKDGESKYNGLPYRYIIIKDMDGNGRGEVSEVNLRDADNNYIAFVRLRKVTDEFSGKVYLWGTGMVDSSSLRFQSNGKPTSETLTFTPEGNDGYYSIFLSSQQGVNVAGYTSEIRVYWDGRVNVVNNWENK